METGRSTGVCGGRNAILLSLSDMSRSTTIAERHNFGSRKDARPPSSAKRVDCGNLEYPLRLFASSFFHDVCYVFICL